MFLLWKKWKLGIIEHIMKKFWLTGIIGIVLLLFGSVYYLFTSQSEVQQDQTDAQSKDLTSTPMPFYSITIPYLRQRTYSSQLGNIRQYNTYPEYTSCLTSYTSDGLKINGLLTIPTGQMPKGGWPAIVFIHGYIPPQQYVTTERYVDYVDYLARSGFVVFKIDLRGHGNSQGKPGGGYYGSDYVVDTLNARAALQTVDFVNSQRVGLWGHSMAGNTVLRSLAARPDIPVAVIWAGAGYSYIDLQKYKLHDTSYQPQPNTFGTQNRRNQIFNIYGRPSAASPFWKLVAPTSYLDDLKGAIEINHAEDDDVVNIGYSRDLADLLDNTKVLHQFYTYPTGGHNISGPSFSTAMQRTVEFYNKYLDKSSE